VGTPHDPAGDEGEIYELLSLPDLVQAKKTQRDKDWPMIRRLIEADHAACPGPPSSAQARFWLREGRTAALLVAWARAFAAEAVSLAAGPRPLLAAALRGDEAGVEAALASEEQAERAADRAYWIPLKQELERMRHA
jgi:hypothetical protein